MATNNGNGSFGRVLGADDLGDEGLCTNDIECRHTKQPLRLKDAGFLEHFGGDWHSAVNRIGNDQDVGIWAVSDDTLDQVPYDSGVDLEEVVTGHARFTCFDCEESSKGLLSAVRTRNSSGNNDNISTGEGLLHAIVLGQKRSHFLFLILARVGYNCDTIELTAGVEMCDKSVPTPGVLTTS